MGVMPATYYKATDVEARSWGNAQIVWKVGRIVRDPADEQGWPTKRLCERGLLHAATVATEAMVSHATLTWPCRLFAVEARGTLVTSSDNPHKVGCRAWKVTAELEAHEVFGPQGVEVVALIERASRLTDDEVSRLYAAWDAARDAAWDAAWYAAWNAARNAAGDAARNAAGYAARYAAGTAARALVVRDLTTAEQFELLYGPWGSVIG